MKLSKIQLRGFRGIRELVELQLTPGFTVISGRNGAGKSTICDAVEYVLTGLIRRGEDVTEDGEDVSDYIRWRGAGGSSSEMLARLVFQDGEERIVVERDADGELSVTTGELGELVRDDRAECLLVEAFVESGEGPESPLGRICDTSIIRDERITQLSVDFGERERYQFVRRGLGTDVFLQTIKRAKGVHDKLESAVEEIEGKLTNARNAVQELEEEIHDARKKAVNIQEVEQAVADVKAALVEYGSLEKDTLSELSKAQLVNRGRQIAIELRENADELARCLSDYRELVDDVAQYSAEGAMSEREEDLRERRQRVCEELEKVQSERKHAEDELKAFREKHPDSSSLAELHNLGTDLGLVGDACPLCGTPHESDEWIERLTILRSEIDEIVDELEKLTGEVEKLREREQELEAEREQLDDRLEEIEDERGKLVSRALRLYEIIKDMVGLKLFEKELVGDRLRVGGEQLRRLEEDRFEEEVDTRRNLRGQLAEATRRIEASIAYQQIDQLEDKLGTAKKNQTKLSEQLEQARSKAEEADEVRRYVEAKRGEVHSERIDQLGPLLLELYKRLRPHVDWANIKPKVRGEVRRFLRFDVGEGDMNPSLFFSSGEKRAVGLAFLLSIHLASSWNRLNTLILDDPVQHIDDFRALQLTEVLSAIRRTGRQLIVTVEDESLARLLTRRLRSTKKELGQHLGLEYEAKIGVQVDFLRPVEPMPSRILEVA